MWRNGQISCHSVKDFGDPCITRQNFYAAQHKCAHGRAVPKEDKDCGRRADMQMSAKLLQKTLVYEYLDPHTKDGGLMLMPPGRGPY